ncbi:hypothetical protein ACJIZ3_004655 [Penstemon smallii]|uniref:Transferase, transferring glycosyl groups n=1 Tax=Penstemon smallii TaxID=265156 RepID=A0ABD3S2P3_9LAMI
MASSSYKYNSTIILLATLAATTSLLTAAAGESPTPKPWPLQFHSILFVNYSGSAGLYDLWYDWPNGRNLNIIQDQLGEVLYDIEWNNGSIYKYTKDKQCSTFQIDVGILRPDWLDGAVYLGQETVDGFLCNVWQKIDFIWYYEDVVTQRPVHWVFYTGRSIHVMTFEMGAVLEDAKWQAPAYCFEKNDTKSQFQVDIGYMEPQLKDISRGSMQLDM